MTKVQLEKEKIRRAISSDMTAVQDIAAQMGVHKTGGYFEQAFEKQESSVLDIFLVEIQGTPAGYCFLNWQPKYQPFLRLNIPEIQDLNVLPDYRCRGIGRAMVGVCEDAARERGMQTIGIGVGLDRSFGAAQRLYVQMGYVPDGNGVTYDREILSSGDIRPVDAQMSLMMVKDL